MGRLVRILTHQFPTYPVSNYSAPSEWGDYYGKPGFNVVVEEFPIIPPQVNGATSLPIWNQH